MSKRTKLQMPKGGRTGRGKDANLSSEDHYLRKLMNRWDGASQRIRKELLKAIGFTAEKPVDREEVIERLKKGVIDFDELVKLAGGERLPGCGAIVPISVGYRPKAKTDEPKILTEAGAGRRLLLLNQLNFYYRERTGEKDRYGNDRTERKREWPGFVKKLITLSPGDSRALVEAVQSGAMTPAQLQDYLKELSKLIRDEVRKATALGGARGLEVEMCVYHLEQGCLHCHLYCRDIDITDPERPRLGLFGRTTTGKGSKRERLTLNSLGISGVAMLRHRDAGHEPPVHVFEDGVRMNWSIVDLSQAKRKEKNLGECWDVTLSRGVDAFWQRVFSAVPALKKCRDAGHEAWAKAWASERSAKLKAIRDTAEKILGPEMAAATKGLKDANDRALSLLRPQLSGWVKALIGIVHGEEPPADLVSAGLFLKHEASGLWKFADDDTVKFVEANSKGRVAQQFAVLHGHVSELVKNFDQFAADNGVAEAKDFLRRAREVLAAKLPKPEKPKPTLDPEAAMKRGRRMGEMEFRILPLLDQAVSFVEATQRGTFGAVPEPLKPWVAYNSKFLSCHGFTEQFNATWREAQELLPEDMLEHLRVRIDSVKARGEMPLDFEQVPVTFGRLTEACELVYGNLTLPEDQEPTQFLSEAAVEWIGDAGLDEMWLWRAETAMLAGKANPGDSKAVSRGKAAEELTRVAKKLKALIEEEGVADARAFGVRRSERKNRGY